MNRLIALLFLGACAVAAVKGYMEAEPLLDQEVDPRLETPLRHWQQDVDQTRLIWRARFARVKSIGVKPLPAGWTGLYDQWSRRLWVSPERLSAGPYSTRATLYHELGHGVFLLKHSSCRLMGPALEEEYYREYWSALVQEYLMAADTQAKKRSE